MPYVARALALAALLAGCSTARRRRSPATRGRVRLRGLALRRHAGQARRRPWPAGRGGDPLFVLDHRAEQRPSTPRRHASAPSKRSSRTSSRPARRRARRDPRAGGKRRHRAAPVADQLDQNTRLHADGFISKARLDESRRPTTATSRGSPKPRPSSVSGCRVSAAGRRSSRRARKSRQRRRARAGQGPPRPEDRRRAGGGTGAGTYFRVGESVRPAARWRAAAAAERQGEVLRSEARVARCASGRTSRSPATAAGADRARISYVSAQAEYTRR